MVQPAKARKAHDSPPPCNSFQCTAEAAKLPLDERLPRGAAGQGGHHGVAATRLLALATRAGHGATQCRPQKHGCPGCAAVQQAVQPGALARGPLPPLRARRTSSLSWFQLASPAGLLRSMLALLPFAGASAGGAPIYAGCTRSKQPLNSTAAPQGHWSQSADSWVPRAVLV